MNRDSEEIARIEWLAINKRMYWAIYAVAIRCVMFDPQLVDLPLAPHGAFDDERIGNSEPLGIALLVVDQQVAGDINCCL